MVTGRLTIFVIGISFSLRIMIKSVQNAVKTSFFKLEMNLTGHFISNLLGLVLVDKPDSIISLTFEHAQT